MRDPGLREQRRTEILVGGLLVVAFIALIMGIFWISGAKPGTPKTTLYASAPEAGAIGEGTRLTLLGVDVGRVNRVTLQPDGVVFELAHSLTHSLTPSLTPFLPHSLPHSFTHDLFLCEEFTVPGFRMLLVCYTLPAD